MLLHCAGQQKTRIALIHAGLVYFTGLHWIGIWW